MAMKVDGLPRGRGRLKRTWMKVVKINMKKCNLSENLAQDRSEWRNRIRAADPKIMIKSVMIYGVECWLIKNQHIEKTSVVEMRMLR
jgi:hypothetical protein